MRLLLPHLPNFIDRVIYNWIKDFLALPFSIIPGIKISNEYQIMKEYSERRDKKDINTIFGLIKLGYDLRKFLNQQK
jgi:hypothetical protein